jgi:hypothetical protein
MNPDSLGLVENVRFHSWHTPTEAQDVPADAASVLVQREME